MSRKGLVLFALMCLVWGIPYLLIKVAVEEVSAPVLVFARTALGTAVLLPLVLRNGGPRAFLRDLRGHWPWLVAFAVTEIIGPWLLLSRAETVLTSSMTGLLIAAVPIIGALLVLAGGRRERFGPVRWAGLVVGFAGVAVLAAPGLRGGDGWAVGEVLLVTVGYATAPLIAERKLAEVPGTAMTTVCLAMAALVYAVPAALTLPARVPSAGALAAIAVLGVVCTAAAFVAFLAMIKEIGASRSTVITYVHPAVAVVAGVAVLGEELTANVAGAFVLILGGSVLATRGARSLGGKRAEAAAEQETAQAVLKTRETAERRTSQTDAC